MKTKRIVKDVECGSIRAMLIQPIKKQKKDGWLLYPSIFAVMAAVGIVGFSGILFTPAGMTIGVICLAWVGICAVANAKATRWGAK